jgi:hypothetical protein
MHPREGAPDSYTALGGQEAHLARGHLIFSGDDADVYVRTPCGAFEQKMK